MNVAIMEPVSQFVVGMMIAGMVKYVKDLFVQLDAEVMLDVPMIMHVSTNNAFMLVLMQHLVERMLYVPLSTIVKHVLVQNH